MKNNIHKKIKTKKTEQKELTRKYALGKITDSLYDEVLDEIENEKRELEIELSQCGDYNKGLNGYLSFGLSLLSNLDVMYEKAPIDIKVDLLGSYFTDKLVLKIINSEPYLLVLK